LLTISIVGTYAFYQVKLCSETPGIGCHSGAL
jgi:hypothetical protein